VSLKKLGRYELVRVLGKGAMGVVYEGRDPNLDRRVAIKTVKVENLSEEAAAEYEHRFRTEARSAARLQHPNIVSVYDSDRDGDIAFLVMEYIQGDDLKHHLDRGVRYSLEQSLKMVRDLLSALDYAHRQSIVHRDIKPANLLIEPNGRLKLTDFGVARIQDSSEVTRTQGSMVGTLKYMSPEQVQGQKIDARADLFSVGVVLYQLLTDKRPFDGDNDFSIIHQIIGHNPPAPSSFNARLPTALDAVVARALAKDREQRFATARDFAVALQSAIRRAEDQTVVPPADPTKRFDTPATGSRAGFTRPGTVPGTVPGGMTSPSTVTQELELVYWKDIKDSTDPEELQGFLDKFPAGIYADLARRRLRRLSSGAAGDQTVLSGTPAMSGNADPDLDATRLRTDGSFALTRAGGAQDTLTATQPLPGAAAAAAAAAALPPAAGALQADATRTRTEVRPEAPVAEASAAAAPSPVPPAKAAPARKAPVAMIAGVAVVAVAAIAAFLASGRGGDQAAQAALAAASAASAASAAAPAASQAMQDASAPLAANGASAAIPASGPGSMWVVRAPASAAAAPTVGASASAGASAPRRNASATRQARAASGPEPAAAPAPPLATASPREEQPRPAAVAPAAASPSAMALVDQCRDKVFLSREFCLAEQCEKPGTRNHPLCVKRREDARLREESKVRQ
jgi:serine/threonine-protein kinase